MRKMWQLYVERCFAENVFGVYIGIRHEDGTLSVVSNLVMTTVPPNQALPGPALKLPVEAAQQLMDELYRAGLRPVDAKAADATLEAQRNHIADLQMIVSRLLSGRAHVESN